MPRGKSLTEEEKIEILQRRAEGENLKQISLKMKRSRCVIRNFLNNPKNYGKRKRSGRRSALTLRDKRAVLRCASNSALVPRQILAECGLGVSVKTVKRVIQKARHLKRKKFAVKPPLKVVHKQRRLDFAVNHLQWKKKWRKVLFTDEKKMNLDGPDGWKYYFHDLRKQTTILSRRQFGGGSVMLWAGVGYNGKTEIKFIDSRLKSTGYLKLIQEQIRNHARRVAGENFIFQQDNAAGSYS
ncbi:Transposable element Tc3 transposase [Anthophora quadrimaculata]